jgi:hypothetical protein
MKRATSETIAQAIKNAGTACLLAVKANQPTLRAEAQSAFGSADPGCHRPFLRS